jgi:deoxycytidine triphosphate deaminase
MILTDRAIQIRINQEQLISGYHPENIRNCAYTLRAGYVFQPETGQEEILGTTSGSTSSVVWEIGPSETLVVMTRERVKVPRDLCATYAPLHRLAQRGVMLLNASLVEPGYEGPLSCFLVNFSSERISLGPDEAIAKIIFHTLTATPGQLKPQMITVAAYRQGLAQYAKKFHKSFMDVTGIEDRAVEKARGELKKMVVTGGVLVAILLAWATFEPIFSKWVWQFGGRPITNLEQVEVAKLRNDLQAITTLEHAEAAKLHNDLQAASQMLQQLLEKKELQTKTETMNTEMERLKSDIASLRTAIKAIQDGK